MYDVTHTITTGDLTPGVRVEGATTGRTQSGRIAFTGTWAGTFDRIGPDVHGGPEEYAYFTNGHINGVEQTIHGFPAASLGA